MAGTLAGFAERGAHGPVEAQRLVEADGGRIGWTEAISVQPEFRRRGIFHALYQHIRGLALSAHDVIGLRLYVEAENLPAQRTYQALGMRPGGPTGPASIRSDQGEVSA